MTATIAGTAYRAYYLRNASTLLELRVSSCDSLRRNTCAERLEEKLA